MTDPVQTPLRGELSNLLDAIREGDRSAFASLLPMVYDDLRAKARGIMSAEAEGHTLQPTALVHEAYVRLLASAGRWESEAHFFNAAAQMMRNILIDHAKAKRRKKRGGQAGRRARVDLADVDFAHPASDVGEDDAAATGLLDIDDALVRLEQVDPRREQVDPRRAQVVTLKFFGGLSDAQVGELCKRDERTVRRDWTAARLWLHEAINAGPADEK